MVKHFGASKMLFSAPFCKKTNFIIFRHIYWLTTQTATFLFQTQGFAKVSSSLRDILWAVNQFWLKINLCLKNHIFQLYVFCDVLRSGGTKAFAIKEYNSANRILTQFYNSRVWNLLNILNENFSKFAQWN